MRSRTVLFAAMSIVIAGCASGNDGYKVDKSRVSPGVRVVDRSGQGATFANGTQIKLVKMVPADYPASLRKANVTGVVVVSHTVMTDGHVENLRIEKSAGESLDRLALAAVAQWRYAPYTPTDAKPVTIAVPIAFNVP